MANAATLAGHVVIEDHATIGAFSGIHQFCRVGTHGYVGGYSVITKDVLPYSKTVSERNTKAYGPNIIGLERKGFTPRQIQDVKAAFRLLLQSKLNTTQAVESIKAQLNSAEVQVINRQLVSLRNMTGTATPRYDRMIKSLGRCACNKFDGKRGER